MPTRDHRTWPDEILPIVRDELASVSPFNIDTVYIALHEDQPEPPAADRFAVIVLGPQRPNQPVTDGAGTSPAWMFGELGVIVWNRFDVDVAGRADAFLTSTSLGLLRSMRLVFKALQMFDPTVLDGTKYLLADALRLNDGGWMTKNRKAQAGWAPIAASWQFQYLADVTSP